MSAKTDTPKPKAEPRKRGPTPLDLACGQIEGLKKDLVEQLEARAVAQSKLDVARKRIETTEAEVSDLKDLVHSLELDAAEMRGYLARQAEEEPPPMVPAPRARRYGQVMGLDMSNMGYDGGYRASSGRPAPWWRR